MSKEKKKTILITSIVAIIALIFIVLFVVVKLKEAGIITTKESREIVSEIEERFNSKERTVIYYASSKCEFCEELTPIINEISEKYDMDYYYVDSLKLGLKQKEKVKKMLNIEGKTPTTIVVENGEVIDIKVGLTDGTTYANFLKDAGVLPEDAVYGDEAYITFVNYDEYDKLISSKGTHIIAVGSTICPHCKAIKPALNAVARDYNLTINYLNLSEITDDENRSFFDSLDTIEYKDEEFLASRQIGTPLVLVVKNGKVSDYFSGERTTSQLVREFRNFGLISE